MSVNLTQCGQLKILIRNHNWFNGKSKSIFFQKPLKSEQNLSWTKSNIEYFWTESTHTHTYTYTSKRTWPVKRTKRTEDKTNRGLENWNAFCKCVRNGWLPGILPGMTLQPPVHKLLIRLGQKMFSEVFVGEQMDLICWQDSCGEMNRYMTFMEAEKMWSLHTAAPSTWACELQDSVHETDFKKLLFWRTAWVFQVKSDNSALKEEKGRVASYLEVCTACTSVV